MTEARAPSENLDMAIALPLGVVASQLRKIEAELRRLDMKSLDFASDRDNAFLAGKIEAGLDNINEALESIRDLVSGIEGGIRRSSREAASTRDRERVQELETGSFLDASYARAYGKSRPDRDD